MAKSPSIPKYIGHHPLGPHGQSSMDHNRNNIMNQEDVLELDPDVDFRFPCNIRLAIIGALESGKTHIMVATSKVSSPSHTPGNVDTPKAAYNSSKAGGPSGAATAVTSTPATS